MKSGVNFMQQLQNLTEMCNFPNQQISTTGCGNLKSLNMCIRNISNINESVRARIWLCSCIQIIGVNSGENYKFSRKRLPFMMSRMICIETLTVDCNKGPITNPGCNVTKSIPFSFANSQAAFSAKVLEGWYQYWKERWANMNSERCISWENCDNSLWIEFGSRLNTVCISSLMWSPWVYYNICWSLYSEIIIWALRLHP